MDAAPDNLMQQIQALRAEVQGLREEMLAQGRALLDMTAAVRASLCGVEEVARLRERKALTVPEAARYAKVASATLRKWLESGALKGTKRGSARQGRWRIRRHDLDAFLERGGNQVKKEPDLRPEVLFAAGAATPD